MKGGRSSETHGLSTALDARGGGQTYNAVLSVDVASLSAREVVDTATNLCTPTKSVCGEFMSGRRRCCPSHALLLVWGWGRPGCSYRDGHDGFLEVGGRVSHAVVCWCVWRLTEKNSTLDWIRSDAQPLLLSKETAFCTFLIPRGTQFDTYTTSHVRNIQY